MTIFKRTGSKFYQFDFYEGGERFQGSTRRTKRSEAEAVEAAKRKDVLDRSQLGTRSSCTVEEAVQNWYEAEGKTLGDSRNNKSRAEKLLGRSLGGDKRYGLPPSRPLHSLTLPDLYALKDARVREGNAPATINRELALVQSVIRCAQARGYSVPLLTIKGLKGKESPKLRWFTPAEEGAILAELDPMRVGRGLPGLQNRTGRLLGVLQDQLDLVVFLLDTGCRYSEAAGITKDVVDLKRGEVSLYRSKTGNEGVLTLTRRLAAVLDRRYSDPALRGPWIFPSRSLGGTDTKGPRGYATSGLLGAINRAGCNEPHLIARYGRATAAHTFRDTFAARLAQAGVSLYKIQALLGHSSPVMTQKYAHLCPDAAGREAASVLDGLHDMAGHGGLMTTSEQFPTTPR